MKVEDRNDSKGSEIDNTHTHTHHCLCILLSQGRGNLSWTSPPSPFALLPPPQQDHAMQYLPFQTRPAPPNFLRSQPVLHWGSQRPPSGSPLSCCPCPATAAQQQRSKRQKEKGDKTPGSTHCDADTRTLTCNEESLAALNPTTHTATSTDLHLDGNLACYLKTPLTN